MFSLLGIGQNISPDTSQYSSASAELISTYLKSVGYSSLLYNGVEYAPGYKEVKGSPFFEHENFELGSVSYNGINYRNLFIKFDIAQNEVIIKGAKGEGISLIKNKVDSFEINDARFIKLPIATHDNAGQTTTFFHRIFTSPFVQLYAIRKKLIKTSTRAEEPIVFLTVSEYYVLKNNQLFKINSKDDLSKVLEDYKMQMNTFFKNSKVNFRKETERFITTSLNYYVSLIK